MSNDAIPRILWTPAMEERLVQLWQEHQCLFNISCKNYHNRLAKEKSWNAIAQALGHQGEKTCQSIVLCASLKVYRSVKLLSICDCSALKRDTGCLLERNLLTPAMHLSGACIDWLRRDTKIMRKAYSITSLFRHSDSEN